MKIVTLYICLVLLLVVRRGESQVLAKLGWGLIIYDKKS